MRLRTNMFWALPRIRLSQMLIGVLIAVGANTVIPIGLNLQKYAHRQAERQVEGACPSTCTPFLNATRNVAACTTHGTHLSAGATVRQVSAHVEPPAVSPVFIEPVCQPFRVRAWCCSVSHGRVLAPLL